MQGDNRSIHIGHLLKFGVAKYRHYFSFLVGVMFTYFVLAIVPQMLYMFYQVEMSEVKDFLLSVVFSMLQLILSLGFAKVTLLLIDDQPVDLRDFFMNFRLLIPYTVATVIYMVAVMGGLMLLVVPGVFLSIRLQFYPYYIIEEGMDGFSALYASFQETSGLTMDLFLFWVVMIGLNLLGFLAGVIGIVLTYPVTMLGVALIYRGLKKDSTYIPPTEYRVS